MNGQTNLNYAIVGGDATLNSNLTVVGDSVVGNRLTLGSPTPLGTSTLYVSGGSYMLGNLGVNGSITTPQNMYLNGFNTKIGIA